MGQLRISVPGDIATESLFLTLLHISTKWSLTPRNPSTHEDQDVCFSAHQMPRRIVYSPLSNRLFIDEPVLFFRLLFRNTL